MMEMQLILAMVAQRYRPHLAPGHFVNPKIGTSLGPRAGCGWFRNGREGWQADNWERDREHFGPSEI